MLIEVAVQDIELKLTLPWPLKELSPNARTHWRTLAKAKKAYRQACAWTATEQGVRRIDPGPLVVSLLFVPPDRRPRDTDNMLASLKAGLDGLADVLGVDDRLWTLEIARSGDVGGFVKVEVYRG
jgi:crossover junction endodeoxyribonuclease RusA